MSDDTLSALRSPLSALPRPEITLDIKPRIKSLDDAELALREVAWCKAVTAAVLAKAEELLSGINEAVRSATSYQVGEESVPVADRRAVLEAELLKWGDTNRETLCPGRKKSVDLRNGRLRWRDGKDTIQRSEGLTAKEAKSLVGELEITEEITVEPGPLAACVQRIIDAVDYHGAISVGLDVNKTSAVAGFKLKQITAEQLEAIGHEFSPGEEYISVEPAEFVRQGPQ